MTTLHRDAAARSPCPTFLNRYVVVIPYPFIESLLCADSTADVKSSDTIRDGGITVGSFCGPTGEPTTVSTTAFSCQCLVASFRLGRMVPPHGPSQRCLSRQQHTSAR